LFHGAALSIDLTKLLRSEDSIAEVSRLHQRCTGAGVSEWTPAGVLTIFENRSGAGVYFLIRGFFVYF